MKEERRGTTLSSCPLTRQAQGVGRYCTRTTSGCLEHQAARADSKNGEVPSPQVTKDEVSEGTCGSRSQWNRRSAAV